jgi:hypothetical protein
MSSNGCLELVEELFGGSVDVPAAGGQGDSGRFSMHSHVLEPFEQRIVFRVNVIGSRVGGRPVLRGQLENFEVVAVLPERLENTFDGRL